MASRFWRFLSRSDMTPTPVICELEMFSSANPTVNLCVGGTATASSEYSSAWLAVYAFDGIKTGNTGWSANDDPFAWLQYEFTSEVEVDEIAITSSSAGNASLHGPRRFFIQYRNEANEWVTRFAYETPQWAVNETRRFTANVTTQSEAVFPIVHTFNGGTPDYAIGEGSFIIPYAYTNFKGDGTISGQLTEKGVPMPGTVTLVHADTQQILKTKETNSLGEYEFTNLRRDFVYDVIAQDLERKWEKRVSSRRVPYANINLGFGFESGEYFAAKINDVALWWRVFVHNNNGASDVIAICELEMAETPGGPNLCVGGTPSTDSDYNAWGWTLAGAFDGIKNQDANGWATIPGHTSNRWIAYTFNEPVEITEVRITPRGSILGQEPRNFTIQKSTDGVTWVDVYTVPEQTSWVALTEKTFTWGQ